MLVRFLSQKSKLKLAVRDFGLCYSILSDTNIASSHRFLHLQNVKSTTTTFRCRSLSKRPYATNKAVSSGGIQEPSVYCRNFVQKHDRDSYLLSMFYPKPLQDACFAVRALYIELAMIPDSVSNAVIGQMRMQFWRDAVKGVFEDRPPQHPIALALHDATKAGNFVPYHLKRIIDARDSELTSPAHLTMETLIAHAESTSSTLNYLLLSILGLSSSDTLSHAASHIGIAQTLVILLRALPYHASKGRVVIPASITAKHHVKQEEILRRGPEAPGIDEAVYEFAVAANDHLITAREMFKQREGTPMTVPGEAMPVFLGAVPVANYLSRLEAAGFNAFEPKLQLRDSLRLPWQIWLSHLGNRF